MCLQWEPVQYFNNKIICDLVEEKFKGIISILVRKLTVASEKTWSRPSNLNVSRARRCVSDQRKTRHIFCCHCLVCLC